PERRRGERTARHEKTRTSPAGGRGCPYREENAQGERQEEAHLGRRGESLHRERRARCDEEQERPGGGGGSGDRSPERADGERSREVPDGEEGVHADRRRRYEEQREGVNVEHTRRLVLEDVPVRNLAAQHGLPDDTEEPLVTLERDGEEREADGEVEGDQSGPHDETTRQRGAAAARRVGREVHRPPLCPTNGRRD